MLLAVLSWSVNLKVKKNIKTDLKIEMSLNYHAELAEKCNGERTVLFFIAITVIQLPHSHPFDKQTPQNLNELDPEKIISKY